MAHGGKREGAGRKPKVEEQKLVEKLSLYNDEAHEILKECVLNKESWAVKMYFEYMYGKPKESVSQSISMNSIRIEDLVKFRD